MLFNIVWSLLPLGGIASLSAAVYYAKKSQRLKAEKVYLENDIKRLSEFLRKSEAELLNTKSALNLVQVNAHERYVAMIQAQDRAARIQADANELALRVATNPDAEAAAREAAEKLIEVLRA